jgi:hypothetical protein
LELKYGPEGTGYFTNILRFLSVTPDHYFCIKEESDKMIFLSRIKTTDEEKTMDIIEIMVKTGKLDKELWEKHKVIVSEAFLQSLEEAYRKRSNEIITIEKIRSIFSGVNSAVNPAVCGLSVEISGNNPQSKVKKSKVKEDSSGEIFAGSRKLPTACAVENGKALKKPKGLYVPPKRMPLFHAAKACFEASEKAKAIMYQDPGSAKMHMENLKLLVARCASMAPGMTADFLQNVLGHFKALSNGRLRGKAEFTPRALITPWVWETVIGSLPESGEYDGEIRECIKGMFQ